LVFFLVAIRAVYHRLAIHSAGALADKGPTAAIERGSKDWRVAARES
jgi:hypothetical protein